MTDYAHRHTSQAFGDDAGARAARPRLLVPALGPVYARLDTWAETVLRAAAGVALIAHGFPKILDPMGAVGMVESIGFHPGFLWAPALAATEFFGGVLLLLGLLTRPAAFATLIVLLVTVWFHWVQLGQGYAGAELSILWSAILFLFVVRGGNRHSLDALIGRHV